jgi:SanA protein
MQEGHSNDVSLGCWVSRCTTHPTPPETPQQLLVSPYKRQGISDKIHMVKCELVVSKLIKMILLLVVVLFILGVLAFLIPRSITSFYAKPRTFNASNAPAKPVAIVFGAGLWRDGSPTPVLRDRVATAAGLYKVGKVQKLLMSGDNSEVNYNEPEAMRLFALDLGIPDEAIVLDYAGRRTYDTCYRARNIFGIKDAVLITQAFHLPRAIYTCNRLGLPAIGVPADQHQYRRQALAFWNLRELPATLVALWEIHYSKPTPILGDPEPIFPLEAQ